MPHGGPDWGTGGPLKTVYTLEDMAELAARLGSIVTFDRRGNIVWMDDFNSGLSKWFASGTGLDNSQAISSELAFHGWTSAKLVCGSDGTRLALLERQLAYPALSRFGLELAWNLGSTIEKVQLLFKLRTATGKCDTGIEFDGVNNKLRYLVAGGDWADLKSPVSIPAGGTLFNVWKIVADLNTREYVRLICNNVLTIYQELVAGLTSCLTYLCLLYKL